MRTAWLGLVGKRNSDPISALRLRSGFLGIDGGNAVGGVQQFDELLDYGFEAASIDGHGGGCFHISGAFREIRNGPAASHPKASDMGIGLGSLCVNCGRRLAIQPRFDANAKPAIAMGPDGDLSFDRYGPNKGGGAHYAASPSMKACKSETLMKVRPRARFNGREPSFAQR
jgi:hypothetical protein